MLIEETLVHSPDGIQAVHARVRRLGVVLINLGSPDSLSVTDVYRYLSRFLSDPRVIPLSPFLWKPLLNFGILPIRAFQSRKRYQTIWSSETGSPLTSMTALQAEHVQNVLSDTCFVVRYAMRYSSPDIELVVRQLIQEEQVTGLVFIPLYPQYASSTTGSTIEEITRVLGLFRYIPPFHIVHHFHDDPRYISALQRCVCSFMEKYSHPVDKLLISFHGVPKKNLENGDPYYCFCQKTARLMMADLPFSPEQVDVCFQSRVGMAKWLMPYTKEHLVHLVSQGVRSVVVVCPGFVSDCLETLEEIQIELKETFLEAGGRHFAYIPCLNQDPYWIRGLSSLITDVSALVGQSSESIMPDKRYIDAFLND